MAKESTAKIGAVDLGRRLVLAAFFICSMLVAFPEKVSASSGCDAFNQASVDGFYLAAGIPALGPLTAGDVITVSAGHPVEAVPSNFVPSTLFLRSPGSNSPIGGR